MLKGKHLQAMKFYIHKNKSPYNIVLHDIRVEWGKVKCLDCIPRKPQGGMVIVKSNAGE